MTPLRQQMTNAMRLRGFAVRTQEAYLAAVAALARHYRVSPERLSGEQLQRATCPRKLEGEAKLEYRSRHAHPVVETFFGWCYDQRQRVDLVTSSPFAKALVYADRRQTELRVYLGDPDVPIDTNHLERALREIPMGRTGCSAGPKSAPSTSASSRAC